MVLFHAIHSAEFSINVLYRWLLPASCPVLRIMTWVPRAVKRINQCKWPGLPLKKMSRLIRFCLSIRISICSNRSRKKINSICIHAPVSFKGTFVPFFKEIYISWNICRNFSVLFSRMSFQRSNFDRFFKTCIQSSFSWILNWNSCVHLTLRSTISADISWKIHWRERHVLGTDHIIFG